MTDLVIRGGTVFDGLGSEGVRADVRVAGDRIVEVGDVTRGAAKEVDATGCYVAPGFVDGHTHLDAQIFWDPYAGSLTAHGVTSAVMGNCGFTLGPGTEDQADLVLRSIERAEDMSRAAIQRGVPWSWTDFVGYLDAVDELPKALNLCAQIGHSALRASVMGERAFTDPASESETEEMRAAVRAQRSKPGHWDCSTSRSHAHVTVAGNPVASRVAEWSEVVALVMAMKEAGTGLFQLAPERPSEPGEIADYQTRLRALAVSSGRPVTFMVGGQEEQLTAVDQVVASGGRAVGQVHVRGFENIFGFKTRLPFDKLPTWSAVRKKSFGEQRKAFEDPDQRRRLIEEALGGDYGQAVGAEVRAPQYDQIMVIGGSRGLPCRDRQSQRGERRGGDDRSGAQQQLRAALPPTHQRDAGRPAAYRSPAPQHRYCGFRLGCAHLTDPRLEHPDVFLGALGPGQAGLLVERGHSHADGPARRDLGPGGPRCPSERQRRRPDRVRP